MKLVKKLTTAGHVFETAGLRGVKLSLGELIGRGRIDAWLRWCMSKYVEIRGNVFTLDGCKFTVDSPAILTEMKSQFFDGR